MLFGATWIVFSMVTAQTPAAVASWDPWACRYDAGSWPGGGIDVMGGGKMNGQGCVSIGRGSDDGYFLVWGSTLLTQNSYWIWTYVEGQDTCGGMGGTYTSHMSSSGVAYNSTSGSSGNAAMGRYQNCLSGHIYRVLTQHQREWYSGAPAEGYPGAVYF